MAIQIRGITFHENYFRIANNHIFTGISQDDMSLLIEINRRKNQHIHVFIANVDCIDWGAIRKQFADIYGDNMLEWMVSSITMSKVIIHIPYPARDLKVLVDHYCCKYHNSSQSGDRWVTADKGYIKPIIERKGPAFYKTKNHIPTPPLRIRYEDEGIKASIDLAWGGNYHDIAAINTLRKNGPYMSELHRRYPELFKDIIINNFIKITPPGILKSFKGDNDIWDYITEEGEWKGDKNEQ